MARVWKRVQMRSLLSERCRLEWRCSEFAQAIVPRTQRYHRDVGHGLKQAKSKMKKRTCFESFTQKVWFVTGYDAAINDATSRSFIFGHNNADNWIYGPEYPMPVIYAFGFQVI